MNRQEIIDKLELKLQDNNKFNINLLNEATKINKKKSTKLLKNYIKWDFIVDEIEKGIFEHSILYIHINQLDECMLKNIYKYELLKICENLDTNNMIINNQTLKPSILNFQLKPYYIAFLSPEELHPVRYANVLIKISTKEHLEANFATTDQYVCWKCKERKGKITQKQVRSADEPITTFIKCMVCSTTFTV